MGTEHSKSEFWVPIVQSREKDSASNALLVNNNARNLVCLSKLRAADSVVFFFRTLKIRTKCDKLT